ncbi:MAG: hypothetical protein ACK4PN_06080 [Allorhizobium sp.]
MSSRTDLPDADRRTRGLRPEPVTATQARQGFRGRPVLIILLAGIVLAMLVWIPAEWWGNSIAPENPSNEPVQQQAPSPAQNTPTPARP